MFVGKMPTVYAAHVFAGCSSADASGKEIGLWGFERWLIYVDFSTMPKLGAESEISYSCRYQPPKYHWRNCNVLLLSLFLDLCSFSLMSNFHSCFMYCTEDRDCQIFRSFMMFCVPSPQYKDDILGLSSCSCFLLGFFPLVLSLCMSACYLHGLIISKG